MPERVDREKMIPGEHDHTTEAPTPPGIVTGFGEDLPATNIDPTLTEENRQQSRWEGGGRLPRTARDVNDSADLGERPVDDDTRQPGKHTHTISGPGAADFLAAPGGEDLPGFSPNKGTTETRDESHFTDPKHLVPRLVPDTEAYPGERKPDEEMPGSATGTIGGGGPKAHKKTI